MNTEAPQQPARRKQLTVAEAAVHFGRSERTIRHWCLDGTLIAFNYHVIRQKEGCWIIVVPVET